MKGKIIWILCKNCLYCSEIRDFYNTPAECGTMGLYLNPIIGNINFIILVDENCDSKEPVFEGFVFNNSDFIARNCLLSFDFDKLCSRMN